MLSGLDRSTLEGRRPLVAKGIQVVPSGTGVLHRTGREMVYFEVYEPLLAGPNPPNVGIQIRLLDRKTGAVKMDTGMCSAAEYIRAGDPVVPVAVRLAVESLPPGPYRVEVKAAHSSGGDAVIRGTDFELD
jgi:hypothetical protein